MSVCPNSLQIQERKNLELIKVILAVKGHDLELIARAAKEDVKLKLRKTRVKCANLLQVFFYIDNYLF